MEGIPYYSRLRLWIPLALAALAAALVVLRLRLTRSHDVMSRLALSVAIVVAAFTGIIALDIALF